MRISFKRLVSNSNPNPGLEVYEILPSSFSLVAEDNIQVRGPTRLSSPKRGSVHSSFIYFETKERTLVPYGDILHIDSRNPLIISFIPFLR